MKKGDTQKVLDHGYVKLLDSMGRDQDIIREARQSTGKGFLGWKKDAGFLRYLYRKQHMGPFEMCQLKLEIQAPLFVARQIFRHRTFSFNEFSGRYAVMPALHYLPQKILLQDPENKQGSIGQLPRKETARLLAEMRAQQSGLYKSYQALVSRGVSLEISRMNTPLSRYTRFAICGNLRNWLHLLDLRTPASAQWESRQFAVAIGNIIEARWPRTWVLFKDYTLHSERFSSRELKALSRILKQSSDVMEIAADAAAKEGLKGREAKEFLQKLAA